MEEITPEKLMVFKTIHQMIIQTILILVALGILVTVFILFICSETEFDKYKFGAANTIMIYTVYRIYKHFFPTRDSAKSDKSSSPVKADTNQVPAA